MNENKKNNEPTPNFAQFKKINKNLVENIYKIYLDLNLINSEYFTIF